MSKSPLAVVPAFARTPEDLGALDTTLTGLQQANCDVLVVDDASPIGSQDVYDVVVARDCSYSLNSENSGFSHAVNVGLSRALDEGRDAVLVNSDVEFHAPGWLEAMRATNAYTVGALLFYPNKTVQHAGIYFSRLTRTFSERFKHAPYDMPGLYEEQVCPVTGALQYIRHECLELVGLYDDEFRMGWEDVDYCLRVFDAGYECRYQPRAMAYHHESMFRGRMDEKIEKWTIASWEHFVKKHGSENLLQFTYPKIT